MSVIDPHRENAGSELSDPIVTHPTEDLTTGYGWLQLKGEQDRKLFGQEG